MTNFALIGAAGYIAPRHLKAIHDTGNSLIAATDPHDNVGILDRYFPQASFFTEIERFDRHLEKMRRKGPESQAHYVSICTPNYLHDAHIRLALRLHAHAICEKPLVINPWNLDYLKELEAEYGSRVYTVLQLRLLPQLIALREKIQNESRNSRHDVCLSYVTSRGKWYGVSWKGVLEKSGGVATNIGIHFFDLLMWLFGKVEHQEVHINDSDRMSGYIELDRAKVRWYLSLRAEDLPRSYREQNKPAFRSITIDGQELEFSDGFTDLHTRVYEDILKGGGFGIDDAYPSIQMVHNIRQSAVKPVAEHLHPALQK